MLKDRHDALCREIAVSSPVDFLSLSSNAPAEAVQTSKGPALAHNSRKRSVREGNPSWPEREAYRDEHHEN